MVLVSCICLYLLSNIAIGAWAARRVTTSQDFVLAGRGLSLALATSVTFATWFGSESIMGAPAKFVEGGVLSVIEEPFGSALCLFLVGAFFAKPLYNEGITTFPDYFRIRFGRSAELLSAVIMIPSYFSWIAAQYIAIGIVLNVVIGIPMAWGIVASATIVMIYTLLGGMWSISITDFLHNLIIILALVVLAVVLWPQVGGVTGVVARVPDGFFRFIPGRSAGATDSTTTSVNGWATYIAAWITIGLGSIPQQDIFQRVMSAKSASVAVRASYLASGLYLTVATLPLFIALSARLLHPDLAGGAEQTRQLIIPNMVMRHGSLPLQILFFGALTSAILSVSSGAILAPATVFGENILKFSRPNITDSQLLKAIRWAIVVISVLCVAMTLGRSTSIFDLVGESSAFSLVSLFVPLTAGIYWKRANLRGCLWAIVVGFGTWVLCLWLKTSFPPMLWGLIASAISMVVGSLWKGRV
ncbi:sodium:solute symporter family protein [Fibrella aquatilis]|uniref:Sodium:solute symporter family protein n=1 Tax=Fibrella aquatilis TaxID=2817059 RepID=A0A939K057_9BACT|nr:sodium:solute symporter family protein [Fibrella aquatilis]MBO0930895.1 sodium:solute symporter family protein [Fibrella aquatilis]